MECGLMSGLLYAESFDDYTETKKANIVKGGLDFHTDYGMHGRGMRVGDAAGTGAYIDLPLPNPVLFYCGFSFKVNTGGGNGQMMQFYTSQNDYMGLLWDSVNQRLDYSIKINSSTNTHIYTPSGSVQLGDRHYVEIYMLSNTGSNGYIELRLNGESHATLGPFDFFVNTNVIRIGSTHGDFVDSMDIDDIYLADDDFRGPIEVLPLLPDGNGNSSDLVGQDADSVNNHLNVDEQDPDDGTTYNGSDLEGDKDTYTFENVPTDAEIIGLFVTQNAAKTDTGAKFIRPVIRIGSTDYVGASHALGTAYDVIEVPFDVSPATAVAFTAAEVNAAEFGSEVRDS